MQPGEMSTTTSGTPAFMAPEVCSSKPYLPFAADVWALGVCLYMLVCGQVPFKGANVLQLYDSIQKDALKLVPKIQVRRICRNENQGNPISF